MAAGLRRAELAVAAGEEEVAVEALQRLLSLEPAQEEGHRFLMSLLARLGRRREALQQFALCTKASRPRFRWRSSTEKLIAPPKEWGEDLLNSPGPIVGYGEDRIIERVEGSSGNAEGILATLAERARRSFPTAFTAVCRSSRSSRPPRTVRRASGSSALTRPGTPRWWSSGTSSRRSSRFGSLDLHANVENGKLTAALGVQRTRFGQTALKEGWR